MTGINPFTMVLAFIVLINPVLEFISFLIDHGHTCYHCIRNLVQRIISADQETSDSRTPLLPPGESFDFTYGLEDSIHDEYRYAENVPPNPPRLTLDYSSRTTSEGQLKRAVLEETSNIVEVFADGMGGIGKTCALRGLATDPDVKQRFADGVLFIKLGNDATKATLMRGIRKIVRKTGGRKLANDLGSKKHLHVIVQHASEWFESKSCLFLVDDVWRTNGISNSDLEALSSIARGRSRMVYTTRDRELAIEGQRKITFVPRSPESSRMILMNHSFNEDCHLSRPNEEALENILRVCAGHPLALSVAGGVVRTIAHHHAYHPHNALQYVSKQLSPDAFPEARVTGYGQVSRVVDVSLISLRLGGNKACDNLLAKLCLLRKQDEPPVAILHRIWGLKDSSASERLVKSFNDYSIIELRYHDDHGVSFTVHDLIVDIATDRAGLQRKQFASQLLDDYMPRTWLFHREWWRCRDDKYIHDNLCRLLAAGDCKKELLWLLSKPQWIILRLQQGGATAVENDIRQGMRFISSEDSSTGTHMRHLQVVEEAALMAHPYVSKNHYEASFQMYGRLLSYAQECERTDRFVQEIELTAPRPWAKASLGILDAAGGALRHVLGTNEYVFDVAFRDNNACFLTQLDVSTINILNGDIDRKNLQFNIFGSNCSTMSTDGKRVVTGYDDGTLLVWDVDSGKVVNALLHGHTNSVECVAISDDGKRVVSGSSDMTVRVWQVESGEVVNAPFHGHTDRIMAVAISGDGKRVVSGSWDWTVRVWEVDSGEVVNSPLHGHTGLITCVAISGDGKRVVSGSSDLTVRVWEVDSGEVVNAPLHGHTDWVLDVAISDDGKRVVSGSSDMTVRVWEVDSGEIVNAPLQGHTDLVTDVAISGDGRSVISNSRDRTVRVWEVDSRDVVNAPLNGHTALVSCVAISGDEKRVVSGSFDMTVRVWEVESGEIVNAPLHGHTDWVTCVAISRDGKRVVSGSSDMTVIVWEVDSGKIVNAPLHGHTDWVLDVALSSDGKRVVSGSDDRTVRVWDIDNGVIVGTPLLHEGRVSEVAVNENAMFVVSKQFGSEIETLWDVQSGRCICTSRESRWPSEVDRLSLTWSSRTPRTDVFQWSSSDRQLNLATLQSKAFRFGRIMFNDDFSAHCKVVDS